MNEETFCITNEGKTAKNKWKNDDFDFFSNFNQLHIN